jgi:AraC-like DNA-binding protein
MRRMHSLKQAAKLAGITEALLALWVEQGRVKPAVNTPATPLPVPGRPGLVREDFVAPAFYGFDDRNIEQIRALAEKPETKPRRKATPDAEFLTVAQVAERWGLSSDTITRLFQDEPGVIPLGNANPRGKRRRVTLRIPVEVVERVKRKRAKK